MATDRTRSAVPGRSRCRCPAPWEDDVLDRLLTVNEWLEAYRRVARLVLTTEAFTQANGCLTRNMKRDRNGVLARLGSVNMESTGVDRAVPQPPHFTHVLKQCLAGTS